MSELLPALSTQGKKSFALFISCLSLCPIDFGYHALTKRSWYAGPEESRAAPPSGVVSLNCSPQIKLPARRRQPDLSIRVLR